MGKKLSLLEASGRVKPMFKEAWLFSAGLSLLANIPWSGQTVLSQSRMPSDSRDRGPVSPECTSCWDLGLPGEWFSEVLLPQIVDHKLTGVVEASALQDQDLSLRCFQAGYSCILEYINRGFVFLRARCILDV